MIQEAFSAELYLIARGRRLGEVFGGQSRSRSGDRESLCDCGLLLGIPNINISNNLMKNEATSKSDTRSELVIKLSALSSLNINENNFWGE